MDRITICLNKILEYYRSYFDSNNYVLQHKPFRNNLLMFKKELNHKKTYMRLEQKLSSFLLNDDVAKRYILYDGDEIITSSIEIIELMKYHHRRHGIDINKFFRRPIQYAIGTSKRDMSRLLKNYLLDDEDGRAIYDKFMSIKWENGMYFEMYKE
jgi:hypothetical protein